MWKCPICGFENSAAAVCPQCRYDPSSDYTRYPTVDRIPELASRPNFSLSVNPSECCSQEGSLDLQGTVLIDSYQASIGGRAVQLYTPDGELRCLNIPKGCKDGDVVEHTKIHVVDTSAPLAEDLTKTSKGELLLYAQQGGGIFAWFFGGIWFGSILGFAVGMIGSSFYNDFEVGIPIIIGAIIGALYGIKRGRKSHKTHALAELKRRGISR